MTPEEAKIDYAAAYMKLLPEIDRLQRELDLLNRTLAEKTKKLNEIEIIDQLTGVYNRKHFMGLLEKEWARSLRYQRGFSLMAFDIDHLKEVNEEYGPDTGDTVLKEVVAGARGSLRKADTLGRYEGECFLAALPETTSQQAWPLAERMREIIATTPYYANDKTFHVTASFGITEAFAVEDDGSDLLVKRAQKGLSNAKNRGANRVEIFLV